MHTLTDLTDLTDLSGADGLTNLGGTDGLGERMAWVARARLRDTALRTRLGHDP
ncbi:hypothetical protein OG883_25460 [Streptomyces sp. NBC_01142]|uniref:hypothetical protein n=1 Tax=Streptomyces sp. NBC_01142 TaxID=2975865 RepID=UPI002255BA8D|nr:hypothetical protein [Streptomyces sp. NBC_01142]MCX4823176.1 hypothetical protein [Streptomyces sp. NBC_01142]